MGLDVPLIHVMYAPGSNIGNLHWIWHSTSVSIDDALNTAQPIIEELKMDIPVFHTRVMRREGFEMFGLLTPSTKKSVLRHLYKKMVSDSSASANLQQAEIDERVAAMFELEELSQWRKQHEDSHYAACLFRYKGESAVLMRDHSTFACIDDKHRIKIGEPGAPVASSERGRQVIVCSGILLQVADHDFASYIPSVVLVCDIPDEVSGSWYTGDVMVMFKEGAFEPSSPITSFNKTCKYC